MNIKNKKGEVIYDDIALLGIDDPDLHDAMLDGDNLGGSTQLQGAILVDAKLQGANLDGCEYDSNTIFPKGFYPQKASMILRPKS